jgi:hypothetical protein
VWNAKGGWCSSRKVEASHEAVFCEFSTNDPVATGDGIFLGHLELLTVYGRRLVVGIGTDDRSPLKATQESKGDEVGAV